MSSVDSSVSAPEHKVSSGSAGDDPFAVFAAEDLEEMGVFISESNVDLRRRLTAGVSESLSSDDAVRRPATCSVC